MENKLVTMHTLTSFNNEVETAIESWNIDEFSEETKKTLFSIIDNCLHNISLEASKLTLYNLVNYDRSLTMELFSQNIEEYIHLMVIQSVTNSYNNGLRNAIEEFSEVLIKAQGGVILSNPEPFSIKFRLRDGEEYWMDIKFSNDHKLCNLQKIRDHKDKAEKEGMTYRLCIYDDEYRSNENYILNGHDFWKLISGFDNAKLRIYRLIKGAANNLSISTIVKETKHRFLREWRMQD